MIHFCLKNPSHPPGHIRRTKFYQAALKNWQQAMVLLALLCLAGLGAGCTAIGSRVANRIPTPPPPVYFGGVRTDCQFIANAGESDCPWFWSVYGVVDLPFSSGADLLLSPYDLYTDLRHDERAKPKSAEAETD